MNFNSDLGLVAVGMQLMGCEYTSVLNYLTGNVQICIMPINHIEFHIPFSGQPIPVIEQYITRDTAVLLKLNATSVVMNVITGGQVLLFQPTANRANDVSDATLVNVSLEGGSFLYVLGLTPGQEYSLKVATVNDAAVSRFTEWINITTTNIGRRTVLPSKAQAPSWPASLPLSLSCSCVGRFSYR